MLRTILLLIGALLLLPLIAFTTDQGLRAEQAESLFRIIQIMLGIALGCFILSELTRNYSQVDKLWSLLPIGYVGYFALESGFQSRLVLMALLVALWGFRLTYNFSRRGGYQWPPWRGEEDYRWAILRKRPLFQPGWKFRLFNLFFISLYQNTLILLFCLPALLAWTQPERPLTALDGLAALLFLLFLLVETLADNQQYRFQSRKKELGAGPGTMPEPFRKGFIDSGLWSLVRHPNYAAEQAIWLSFYLFSVAATGRWFNWSLSGAILLILLFLGSSDFSEKISASRYPDYEGYRKKTPRFVPRLRTKRLPKS